ncbi:MAG: hypothetical protein Ta2B_09510 [Termitinemataceae bacterium]|nr:MAG: hypothetical protein Ta2B_09510 [Termitinemataceae bacterium]
MNDEIFEYLGKRIEALFLSIDKHQTELEENIIELKQIRFMLRQHIDEMERQKQKLLGGN